MLQKLQTVDFMKDQYFIRVVIMRTCTGLQASVCSLTCNLRKLTIFFPKLQQNHTVLLTATITENLHETLKRD